MKKVKADDYYNDGVFELARFGNTVVSSNHMTEEQHTLWVRKIAESYEPLVEEINDLVTALGNIDTRYLTVLRDENKELMESFKKSIKLG